MYIVLNKMYKSIIRIKYVYHKLIKLTYIVAFVLQHKGIISLQVLRVKLSLFLEVIIKQK